METTNVTLTGQNILEKEFKTSMRGYNQDEVDEYLDIIIKDYEMLQNHIERLTRENERLKQSSEQTRSRVAQPVNQANYDVLKRLSNLEKEVFGRKFLGTE